MKPPPYHENDSTEKCNLIKIDAGNLEKTDVPSDEIKGSPQKNYGHYSLEQRTASESYPACWSEKGQTPCDGSHAPTWPCLEQLIHTLPSTHVFRLVPGKTFSLVTFLCTAPF